MMYKKFILKDHDCSVSISHDESVHGPRAPKSPRRFPKSPVSLDPVKIPKLSKSLSLSLRPEVCISAFSVLMLQRKYEKLLTATMVSQ